MHSLSPAYPELNTMGPSCFMCHDFEFSKSFFFKKAIISKRDRVFFFLSPMLSPPKISQI